MSAASWCSGRSRAGRPASAFRSAAACAASPRRRAQVQRVEDVHAFPGHIACDSASNSEMVVPISATASCSACSTSTARSMRGSTRRIEAGCRPARRDHGEGDLAQLLQPLVAQRAGDDHHRARQLAGIIAGEMGDQRPGLAATARRRAPARRYPRACRYGRAPPATGSPWPDDDFRLDARPRP